MSAIRHGWPWLLSVALGCGAEVTEPCDACIRPATDAEGEEDAAAPDAGPANCSPSSSFLPSMDLRGEDRDSWSAVVTATSTLEQSGNGIWSVPVGSLTVTLRSNHPSLVELEGPVRVTFYRSGAMVVFGWAAAVEPLDRSGPTAIGWSSYTQSTLGPVLGQLATPPLVRYAPQGCELPNECGDRPALKLTVNLGDGPIEVPFLSSKVVGESELTNGASHDAPVESRCTDQPPRYIGTLILSGP